ncbi:MAG: hypothetical protein QOF14_4202 [Hyphomicrobiales bacterium]|jgi:hypothetical protein|nr:hypothetical protein [Hyphomicrobiales bacterium]
MPQIEINALFGGVSDRGATEVTISGMMIPAGTVCPDLQVALSCPASQSSGAATIDGRTGRWTAELVTACGCGTDLVTVVASSASLGCSSTSTGPIVCYVDWQGRSVIDRLMDYRSTIGRHPFLAVENFGSCYKCITIAVALFALSTLILAAAVFANSMVAGVIGLLATAASGSLVGLHAVFFFLRKREEPAMPQLQEHERRCCGG